MMGTSNWFYYTSHSVCPSNRGKINSETALQGNTTKNENIKPSAATGKLTVHFIDVGQADSILIQTPKGNAMLIDAGNNADGDKVVEYLKSQGVQRLVSVIGTHPHEDHIGGLDNVLQLFEVGKLYMPKVTSTTKTFEDVITSAQAKGLKLSAVSGGTDIDPDETLKVQVFAPNSLVYKDLNNYSIVLKVTYGNTSFLLTGDAEDVNVGLDMPHFKHTTPAF